MTSASTFWDETADESDRWQIPTHAEEIARLPQRPLKLAQTAAWLHGEPPAEDEVIVQISPQALVAIAAHANRDLSTELGGVLLGRAGRDDGILHVEIEAALPAHSNDHGPIHFTFTADAWSQIHRERAEYHDNMPIVGWFHTHPDLGVFFSNDDVVVHTAAFVMPWHVALVVDPVRAEAAFFGWRGAAPAPLSGFYECPKTTVEPTLPWRPVAGAVWAVSEAALATSEEQWEQREERSPAIQGETVTLWRNAAIGGAVVLLFLLSWLATLHRQNQSLRAVAGSLTDQSLALASENGLAQCTDRRLQIASPAAGGNVVAGTRTAVVGSARWPDAARYEVAVRPYASDGWVTIGRPWRDATLGKLANWDTRSFDPGVYEMRLVALDSSGALLYPAGVGTDETSLAAAEPLGCTIRLQLINAVR